MQIFVVEHHPEEIALALCDKHIETQIQEIGELLAIAHTRNGELIPPTSFLEASARFVNHPCAKWVARTEGNYKWTYTLAIELCHEFTHRTGFQHHLASDVARMIYPPFRLMEGLDKQLTIPPPVVPKRFIVPSCVMTSYRKFYEHKAARMRMLWTKRIQPMWLRAGVLN